MIEFWNVIAAFIRHRAKETHLFIGGRNLPIDFLRLLDYLKCSGCDAENNQVNIALQ